VAPLARAREARRAPATPAGRSTPLPATAGRTRLHRLRPPRLHRRQRRQEHPSARRSLPAPTGDGGPAVA